MKLFDFNRDGRLSNFEKAVKFATYATLMDEIRKDQEQEDSLYDDYSLSSCDDDDDFLWHSDEDDFSYHSYSTLDDYYSEPSGYSTYSGDPYSIDEDDSEGGNETGDARSATDESFNAHPLTLTMHVVDKLEDARKTISKKDYPNKRSWNAACELAARMEDAPDCGDYLKLERERAEFVLSNPDVAAAQYFAIEEGFLYAQAAKERFDLPITVPDEDEKPKTRPEELIKAIALKDANLAFDVWAWLIEEFVPYSRYEYCKSPEEALTVGVLDEIASMPEEVLDKAVSRFVSDATLRKAVFAGSPEIAWEASQVIARALESGNGCAAGLILSDILANPRAAGHDVASTCTRALLQCQNYRELETVLSFEASLMPLLRESYHVAVQAAVPEWEREIAEYVQYAERSCPQYVYERGNAWRKSVPDGSAYGLDPVNYETEDEYLAALERKKYGWRRRYDHADTLGLSVEEYEVREEFTSALEQKRREKTENRSRERYAAEKDTREEARTDTSAYRFAGVLLGEGARSYSYLIGDNEVSIGDKVIVPVGKENEETEGEVVSVTTCSRLGAPYPPEKCKSILRKVQAP